jgi:DNA modification methylase
MESVEKNEGAVSAPLRGIDSYLDRIICGDNCEVMRKMPSDSINCCVTSPPYFGLRDYGHEGQIGLEETPGLFVAKLVEVFREVRRLLRDDGTLWLNLGDSYSNIGKTGGYTGGVCAKGIHGEASKSCGNRSLKRSHALKEYGLKPKELIGIPWLVAFALQSDGWYLRQDIIWNKPNPMPESVTDRCTKSHEYIFLLSKSVRYFYDAEAIAEPVAESSIARLSQPNLDNQAGSNRVPGKTNGNMKAVGSKETRNKRSVWTVNTMPYKGAHFATFPTKLIEPCILAGCHEGGVVLDPFFGAGTTALVCKNNGRRFIGIELNPEYVEISKKRLSQQLLF